MLCDEIERSDREAKFPAVRELSYLSAQRNELVPRYVRALPHDALPYVEDPVPLEPETVALLFLLAKERLDILPDKLEELLEDRLRLLCGASPGTGLSVSGKGQRASRSNLASQYVLRFPTGSRREARRESSLPSQ